MNDAGIAFGKGRALNTIGKSNKSPFKDRAEVQWDWGTTIGYEGVFTNGTVSGSKLIGNTIEGGSLDIGDGNFTVDEDGNLTANSGVFKGTVQGATFKTAGGSDMMNSKYQFLPDYLTLLGMEIVSETTGDTTFKVDNNGNVTVKGNITLGSGSSIQWEYIDETDSEAYNEAKSAKTNIYKLANGTYTGGTFIDGTTMAAPTMRGGYIVGGKFFAVDDVNATITNSDITGCVRMIIDNNGISSYNERNKLDGISLTANSGFGDLKFYYQGDERGSLHQSGGTMYLNSTQRLIIGRGGGDVWFDDGDVKFKGSVDFSSATVTGLVAKFG